MSNEWFDKAKQAALNAAEGAKNAAQNANFGEILDKTKNMAMQAADEAKKAAGTVMSKDKKTDQDMVVEPTLSKEEQLQACAARISKIEVMLQQVKEQLAKLNNPS